MEDTKVEDLLTSWGMPQEIRNAFRDAHMDEFALQHIDKTAVDTLIPIQGYRIRFNVLHAEWVKGMNHQEVASTPPLKELTSTKPNILLGVIDSNGNFTSKDMPEILLEGDEPTSTPDQPHTSGEETEIFRKSSNQASEKGTLDIPQPSGKETEVCRNLSGPVSSSRKCNSYDLDSMLRLSVNGKHVLQIYNSKKELSDRARNLLATCVIENELQDDQSKVIPKERFDFLSQQILEKFIGEVKETYFVSYRHPTNKKLIAKGKLIHKYYNLRREYSMCGLISNRCASQSDPQGIYNSLAIGDSEHVDDPDDPERIDDPKILWLKGNTSPWSKVVEYWRMTSKERMNGLINGQMRAFEYTALYPAITTEKGFELFEIDFESMYPDASLKLYTEWIKFSSFIKGKLDSVFTKDTVYSSDEIKLLVLLNATKIFNPIIIERVKGRKMWKPSKVEMQDAFLLHVETTGELQEKLDARRTLMKSRGLCLQPQPVVIGPMESPLQYLVVVDRYFYEVESAMKAIDIAFKTYFALHAAYPPEAKQLWAFIQRGVYGITTEFDEVLPTVAKILGEYKLKH